MFEQTDEIFQLEDLKNRLKTKIEVVLDHFGVKTFRSGEILVGSCPVHCGDNPTAFNVNTNRNSGYCGKWFCNTHSCHTKYGGDVIGLLRGLISNNKKDVTFPDVLKAAQLFVDSDSVKLSYDPLSDILFRGRNNKVTGITRETVRSKLKIPSEYYLKRGFSEEVLDYFDVGLCDNPVKEMYNRIVFPVYDNTDRYMIGSVGRTIIGDKRKWKNQDGFKTSDCLYGYNKTISYVCRTGTAILVEGQGDLLKLWMAGIKNVFGLFGSNVDSAQELILQKTGITNIITFGDNDEAGNKLRHSAYSKLKRLFNIRHVIPEDKDPGDTPIEKLKLIFSEYVDD